MFDNDTVPKQGIKITLQRAIQRRENASNTASGFTFMHQHDSIESMPRIHACSRFSYQFIEVISSGVRADCPNCSAPSGTWLLPKKANPYCCDLQCACHEHIWIYRAFISCHTVYDLHVKWISDTLSRSYILLQYSSLITARNHSNA